MSRSLLSHLCALSIFFAFALASASTPVEVVIPGVDEKQNYIYKITPNSVERRVLRFEPRFELVVNDTITNQFSLGKLVAEVLLRSVTTEELEADAVLVELRRIYPDPKQRLSSKRKKQLRNMLSGIKNIKCAASYSADGGIRNSKCENLTTGESIHSKLPAFVFSALESAINRLPLEAIGPGAKWRYRGQAIFTNPKNPQSQKIVNLKSGAGSELKVSLESSTRAALPVSGDLNSQDGKKFKNLPRLSENVSFGDCTISLSSLVAKECQLNLNTSILSTFQGADPVANGSFDAAVKISSAITISSR